MLVIEYKLVTFQYFMDELKDWELYWLLQNCHYGVKQDWMMTRENMYVTAQVNSTKKLGGPEKFYPLPYDNDNKEQEEYVPLTKEEINRENEKSDMLAKYLSGKLK